MILKQGRKTNIKYMYIYNTIKWELQFPRDYPNQI